MNPLRENPEPHNTILHDPTHTSQDLDTRRLHTPSPQLPIQQPRNSCTRHSTTTRTRPHNHTTPRPLPTLNCTPRQTMLWDFVQPQMPPPTQNPGDLPSQTSQQSTIELDTTPLDSTPPAPLSDQRPPTTMYQRPLTMSNNRMQRYDPPQDQMPSQPQQPILANDGWGDLTQYSNPQQHFRIISKNVSTLNPQSLDMVAIATELQSMQASVFLAQETNTAWTPTALNGLQNQCRKVYPQHKLATSSSAEKNKGWFQPGGTCIIALGSWASRVIGWGQDELLGRWSFLEMVGQQGRRTIVVSAYRVCKQDFDATTNTATAQQTRLLLQQGHTSPNPRQQFISDLIVQVKKWRQQGKEVLIGMDANEDVDNTKSHISRIFAETDLIDLHHHRHPAQPKPATYQRGTDPIDMIIGSELFAAALTAAWMLPFGAPPLLKGDHRLIGADFHPGILFGSSPIHPANGPIRGC